MCVSFHPMSQSKPSADKPVAKKTQPAQLSWLLLLYSLPQKHGTERVNFWRKLRKFGALQFKPSGYLLPDEPTHYERFQWLAGQIRESGGEASLIRVGEIEGMSGHAIKHLFHEARTKDYDELGDSLREFINANKKIRGETFNSQLEKLRRRYLEIREIDYFDSPAAQDVQMLLQQAERLHRKNPKRAETLDKRGFQKRKWLTRPHPEVDRVGAAWLIRRWIDPEAKFVFATTPAEQPDAIPYDMADVEFTHHGDHCTFETLLDRFNIKDRTLQKISEMIHDADLEDGKFQRQEGIGLEKIFKGWAKMGLTDHQILERGWDCFDALYAQLKR